MLTAVMATPKTLDETVQELRERAARGAQLSKAVERATRAYDKAKEKLLKAQAAEADHYTSLLNAEEHQQNTIVCLNNQLSQAERDLQSASDERRELVRAILPVTEAGLTEEQIKAIAASVDFDKIKTVVALRRLSGLGLSETKKMVDDVKVEWKQREPLHY